MHEFMGLSMMKTLTANKGTKRGRPLNFNIFWFLPLRRVSHGASRSICQVLSGWRV